MTNSDYLTRQIFDLSDKLEQSELTLSRITVNNEVQDKKNEDKFTKTTRDCSKTGIDVLSGTIAQVIKDRTFNNVHSKKQNKSQPTTSDVLAMEMDDC